MKKKSNNTGLFSWTLIAFAAALIVGMILRAITGDGVSDFLAEYILTPVKTMYMSALKLVVAPVVFFAISSSISGLTNVREYGRIGMKILLLYFSSSIIACLVGLGMDELLQPGTTTALDLSSFTYTGDGVGISLMDTLVSIIPSDIITPFADYNMLAIIFMALLLGVGANTMKRKEDKERLSDKLSLLDRLFQHIAYMVIKFIPLATFCSMLLLTLKMGTAMLLPLLQLILAFALGIICMMVIYSIVFVIYTKRNPLIFIKKIIPNMISFMALCSTGAVLPQTIETCTDSLGVSPKVSAFSIPLGSTINMNGTCIYLVLTCLFLARIYEIEVTTTMIVSLVFSSFVLSVGAPSIPGAGFICLSVLVADFGLPIDSIGIIMGVDQIMSMFRTLTNGVGDMLCTTIVAHQEGLMDMEVFDRK